MARSATQCGMTLNTSFPTKIPTRGGAEAGIQFLPAKRDCAPKRDSGPCCRGGDASRGGREKGAPGNPSSAGGCHWRSSPCPAFALSLVGLSRLSRVLKGRHEGSASDARPAGPARPEYSRGVREERESDGKRSPASAPETASPGCSTKGTPLGCRDGGEARDGALRNQSHSLVAFPPRMLHPRWFQLDKCRHP
jgi:hypothetical protein